MGIGKSSMLDRAIQGIKKVTRRFGVDIVKHNFYHSDAVLLKHLIRHFNIRTIIDGGANTGQYASDLFAGGFQGEIHSFEPIPGVFASLAQHAKKHPKWSAYGKGLGSKTEQLMIHVSENLVSSSIYKVKEASLQAEPTTRITHEEKIELTTVDEFLSTHAVSEEILLKLDVQGYEIEALKGATASLSRIRLIQAELSLAPLYDNAPLFDEVIAFLKARNFELFTLMPGFRDDETGQMLQADGIFLRK